ncbi:hypothetical protein RND81_09G042200 [Saponaria officinalis]|uniref:Uncharacterized protein n=1 Tax=Saponaria officinalis TaxID=3572 RepID=A0AAW1IHW6_SAPOF
MSSLVKYVFPFFLSHTNSHYFLTTHLLFRQHRLSLKHFFNLHSFFSLTSHLLFQQNRLSHRTFLSTSSQALTLTCSFTVCSFPFSLNTYLFPHSPFLPFFILNTHFLFHFISLLTKI